VVLKPKKLEIRKKNCKNYKSKKTQILCHEIEPKPSKDKAMHEGDNPLFADEFINLLFFIVLFLFVFLSKYRSTYLLDL
jgi:hypothetical protein